MKKNKGVLTVEAAIMIPMFVFSILFMTQFMKIVYIYDTVQTNIYNTAKFIHGYSAITEKFDKDINNKITEVQAVFTNITDGVVNNDTSDVINQFIGNVLQGAKQSVKDASAGLVCKKMLENEFEGKEDRLGIKNLNTKVEFSQSKLQVVVNYTVNVSAPFINIDKDVNLKNQVVIENLGN